MDDAFTYTCKAFELAEGGTTVFEVEEYLLLDGFSHGLFALSDEQVEVV